MAIQPQLNQGVRARILSQEWGSRTVWFTLNAHPVASHVQGTSGSGSSAFCKSHLSPLRTRFITEHRAIFWSHSSPPFPPPFSVCGRERATLIKAQYVTDTTPMRAWGPTDKWKRQSSQFCRSYRASQPCCGHCNVTVLDVPLTWRIKWLRRRGRLACDYDSRDSGDRSSFWHRLSNSSMGMEKPLNLWVNKGKMAGKDGS